MCSHIFSITKRTLQLDFTRLVLVCAFNEMWDATKWDFEPDVFPAYFVHLSFGDILWNLPIQKLTHMVLDNLCPWSLPQWRHSKLNRWMQKHPPLDSSAIRGKRRSRAPSYIQVKAYDSWFRFSHEPLPFNFSHLSSTGRIPVSALKGRERISRHSFANSQAGLLSSSTPFFLTTSLCVSFFCTD